MSFVKNKQLTENSSLFLDILRAFSVQLVVVGHGISYCSIWPALSPPNMPYMQNIAVVIFFLLSGYLISNSVFYKLSVNAHYSFRSYFIDRFSRIYGALIPALLLVVVMDYASIILSSEAYLYNNAFDRRTFFGNILMLQDFPFLKHLSLPITSFGSARPLWTLAIEWWIYMWFGFFTIKVMREGGVSLKNSFVFLLLCIVPVFNTIGGRGNGLTIYWLFGVLVCLLYDKYKTIQLSNYTKTGMLAALLLIAAIRVKITMSEYEPVFAFLLAICLLISIDLFSTVQINKRIASLIRFIANYSYTLYLIHYSIYDFISIHFKQELNGTSQFVIGFLISNLLAMIIGYYTETKFTKFVKKKLNTRFVVKPA